MRESTSARGPLPRATGVVDSLSAGFGVVNEQPWIVLIPILLDLFFLFGPRVSIAPVIGQIVTRPELSRALGADSTSAALALAEETNLLGLLSPAGMTLPTIVPALASRVGGARGAFIMVDSVAAAFLVGLGAVLIGAFLGCLYRVILSQQAREGELTLRSLPAESVVAWGRVIALTLLLTFVGFFAIVPLAFIAALASLATAAATAIMTAIVATVAIAAQLYLFFAPDAIFISRVGPIQAIRQSAAVVHAGIWSALTLAILITVILIGMSQVWIALAGQASWGLALGIVGNAYVASGLVAASMLFYRERMENLLAQRS
ncbi:MAG: hypothetical protein U0893_02030 [Chloroflexota bacterium]